MAQVQSAEKAALIAAALVCVAGPVSAAGLGACYARAYSEAHLASHPIQQVGSLALVRADVQSGPPGVVYDLHVRLKDAEEDYFGAAYCEPAGSGWSCGMEGDAGRFTIVSRKGGAILIRLAPDGISFEGESDFLTLSGRSGDDREFLLQPCD